MVYVVPAGLNCGCIPLTAKKKQQSLSKPLFTGEGLPTQDINFLNSLSYVMLRTHGQETLVDLSTLKTRLFVEFRYIGSSFTASEIDE